MWTLIVTQQPLPLSETDLESVATEYFYITAYNFVYFMPENDEKLLVIEIPIYA